MAASSGETPLDCDNKDDEDDMEEIKNNVAPLEDKQSEEVTHKVDKAAQVSTEVVREPLINLLALDNSSWEFLAKSDLLVDLMESQSRFSYE